MGTLVFGIVLLFAAFLLRTAAATVGAGGAEGARGRPPIGGLMRMLSLGFTVAGLVLTLFSAIAVIDAGQVGVQHAFGSVSQRPLLSGIRLVPPWSSIERFSTREEQFPERGEQAEEIAALSSEQMGTTVDVSLRWQIDPQQAPRIFTEIGDEAQIRSAVRNAIREGVRDGMVQYSINDIAKRTLIANTMESLVDSALVTQPRAGGDPFRIATVTAFFLRDLQPPAQVVQAINNKIAQEQQIETERHRVEVARLQAEQQRLLNQTLTAEALTKQYLEVLHDMRTSNNLVVLVPTEGGVPMLNLGDVRRNLRPQP
jgi:regulator of protease activity HflC (stomatin/prohibitin superfamily)